MMRAATFLMPVTRILAFSLALALSHFTVEGAVDSVRHLDEPDQAVSCTVAGVASQAASTPAASAPIEGQLLASREAVPEDDLTAPRVCPLRPDEERAPSARP